MPKVSILIPFYNCRYIAQAVDSALRQTYLDIEVIVVDDGSTAETHQILPFMPRIRYIRKSNGGTASALNTGLNVAEGDYFAWLSSDDLFYPDKIVRQLAFMQQQQALISFTDYHRINAAGEIIEPNATFKFKRIRDFIAAFGSFCPFNGCTVMMRTDVARRLGGFNEQLPYTHDYDFWLRVVLARLDVHYLPEPLTAYRWHEEMGTMRKHAAVQQELQQVIKAYKPRLDDLLSRL